MSVSGLTGICGVCSDRLVVVVQVDRAPFFFVSAVFYDPDEDGDKEFTQFPS